MAKFPFQSVYAQGEKTSSFPPRFIEYLLRSVPRTRIILNWDNPASIWLAD